MKCTFSPSCSEELSHSSHAMMVLRHLGLWNSGNLGKAKNSPEKRACTGKLAHSFRSPQTETLRGSGGETAGGEVLWSLDEWGFLEKGLRCGPGSQAPGPGCGAGTAQRPRKSWRSLQASLGSADPAGSPAPAPPGRSVRESTVVENMISCSGKCVVNSASQFALFYF